MIAVIVLFLLIIGISFLLAFQSMRDYQKIPKKVAGEYSLFLVRKPENFNADILNSIQKQIFTDDSIISIERLFKGSQSALTVFGPREALNNYGSDLSLLELEDYTLNLDFNNLTVWEVGLRGSNKTNQEFSDIFSNLPVFSEDDQFFWQVILSPKKDKEDLMFQTQIRAVLYSTDPVKRKSLGESLQTYGESGLVKVPRPYSVEQMMSFYKLRSLSKETSGPILNAEQVIRLFKIT